MKKRFIALLLAVLLVMSLAPQSFAASIDDYPNGVNVMIRSETPHTYLDITTGGYTWGLSARIWSYITADGSTTGPAYCINHGSGYPTGYIAVDTTPYTANPTMTAAFGSGFPLVSLETFTQMHPECAGLTRDEYDPLFYGAEQMHISYMQTYGPYAVNSLWKILKYGMEQKETLWKRYTMQAGS